MHEYGRKTYKIKNGKGECVNETTNQLNSKRQARATIKGPQHSEPLEKDRTISAKMSNIALWKPKFGL